jgi:hypothetical protein
VNVNKVCTHEKSSWKPSCMSRHCTQMVVSTCLLCGVLPAVSKATNTKCDGFRAMLPLLSLYRVLLMEPPNLCLCLQHLPFYSSYKKFVSFSLRSHNLLTHTHTPPSSSPLRVLFHTPSLLHSSFNSQHPQLHSAGLGG